MGQNAKDGIFSIQCMNTKDVLTVYNDAKYWNHDLRDEFMAQTRTLWGDNNNGPYNGRVFKSQNLNTPEEQLMTQKVERELAAAVEKLGKVTPYKMPE